MTFNSADNKGDRPQGQADAMSTASLSDLRGRTLYITAGVFTAVALGHIFLTQGAAPGLTPARIIGFSGALVFAASAALYYLTGKRIIASWVLLVSTFATIFLSSLQNGGAPAPAMPFFVLIPVAATILINRTAALISVAVIGAGLIYLNAAAGGGAVKTSPHSAEEFRLLFVSAVFLSAIATVYIAFSYERLVKKALQDVGNANQRLTQRADALEENKDFLFKVLESVRDCVAAADNSGRLTLLNRAGREIRGFGLKDVDYEHFPSTYKLYKPDGITPLKPEEVPLYQALKGEDVHDVELVIIPDNLPKRLVVVSASPIRDVHGNQIGAVATAHDVTEERRQAEEIRRKNEELEQFARVASHDLQEPLRKLIVFCDFLRQDIGENINDKVRDDIEAINDSSARMLQLVKDILRLSRMPGEELALQPVSPAECIEAALKSINMDETSTPSKINYDDLPTVMADPTLLTQVYFNLITNAVKFVGGNTEKELKFTCERNGADVILGVQDNGIGIAPEYHDVIFEPLTRLHRREMYQGTGIGLAICKKAIAKLGGKIWVENNPDGGAHFRFQLKAMQSKDAVA